MKRLIMVWSLVLLASSSWALYDEKGSCMNTDCIAAQTAHTRQVLKDYSKFDVQFVGYTVYCKVGDIDYVWMSGLIPTKHRAGQILAEFRRFVERNYSPTLAQYVVIIVFDKDMRLVY